MEGLCICFEGFSTFDCKPLLNIHDCVTKAEYRQKGVCSALFARIVEDARTNGFCKVTLEVLSGMFSPLLSCFLSLFLSLSISPFLSNWHLCISKKLFFYALWFLSYQPKPSCPVCVGNGVAIETYKKLGFEGYTLGEWGRYIWTWIWIYNMLYLYIIDSVLLK